MSLPRVNIVSCSLTWREITFEYILENDRDRHHRNGHYARDQHVDTGYTPRANSPEHDNSPRNICGAAIEIVHHEGYVSKATIGGLIELDHQKFGLTVAHAFETAQSVTRPSVFQTQSRLSYLEQRIRRFPARKATSKIDMSQSFFQYFQRPLTE